ncbi:MAG TPA: sulfatase [Candidatus Limnocylindria bacterium]|nr:sulfatase [Candidatus Limnocylindria bacterium]
MGAATPPVSRLAAALGGAALGAAAGVSWALVEGGLNWASGGTAPADVVRVVFVLDVVFGAVGGAATRAVVPGTSRGMLALVLLLAYAGARVVAPPGVGSELAVLVGGIALLALARRWVAARQSLADFLLLVGLGALALLSGELWLESSRVGVLRGVWLPLACLGLPAAAVVATLALGRVVRRGGVRLAGVAGVLAITALVAGKPLDTAPLVDPVVTGVPPPPGTPDVILVSLDTTRVDRLSTYGYERDTSPHLTRLAADGQLYRMARSPAGWTLPAHASMMTGLFPRSHGAHLAGGFLPGDSVDGRPQVAYPLRAGIPTLAELLRDRGYETGAFVANFSYLYRDYGLARGFGIYDDAPGLLLRARPPMVRLTQLVRPSFCRKPFRTASAVNEAALAWLDARPAGRPAFLFVNYMEPHQPWVADPPYDRWAASLPRAGELARKNLYTHAVRPLDPDTTRFINAHYDGQVTAMDAALGELLDALRQRGRYDNALVIVTADHGELLGEHGQMGHMGRMLYEPLLRVPLVVKRPGGARRGEVIDTPVQLVDLLPTVAQVVGVATPEAVEGKALDDGPRRTYAEEGINPFLVERYGAFYDRAVRVVYDGNHKLISTSRGERMLFDLAADPQESSNRAAAEPERVQELSQQLELGMPHLAAVGPSTEKKVE